MAIPHSGWLPGTQNESSDDPQINCLRPLQTSCENHTPIPSHSGWLVVIPIMVYYNPHETR